MEAFCLQSRHKNLRLVKINKEKSVAELTGLLEETYQAHIVKKR